jgi:sugar O-acyltransferase (sialic acid O-acetyltransferase NeuD family)
MANEARELVIVGDGESAEIAYEYFTKDSPHRVVAFSVEGAHLKKKTLYDLPVVPFEEVQKLYPPSDYAAFVAISSTHLNRLRKRLFIAAKEKGYRLVSFVSPHAFVWRNVEVGENTFIFENNVLQHHVKVGSNVVLWSGNHIGHRTVIQDHVFISSHVVISGFCEIGESSFLGVNSCLADNIKIAKDCVVGAGAVVVKHADPGQVYVGNPAKPLPNRDAYQAFNVPEQQR